MLKTARKHKTNLAAIRLSPGVRASLPTWYHPSTETCLMTNVNVKCLLNNHKIKTVADLIKSANKTSDHTQNSIHTPNQACICKECIWDRRKGCRNPHACALEARARLNDIAPKYNPIAIEHHDMLSLTPDRKARNVITRQERKAICFDPLITCKDGIAECFRVFTDLARISRTLASRCLQRGTYLDHLEMRVYTDGSCTNNGNTDVVCGSGVWVERNHPLNKAIRVPGNSQSNQVGELVAVLVAAETIPNYCKLTIVTDSEYVINGLTKHLETWEDNSWIEVKNTELFKHAAYLLKKRTAPTYLKWVKGHQGVLGNEESDKLAKEGASKDAPNPLSLHIPDEFDLQGAKLETLTQAIAYRGIRRRQPETPRATMNRNIDLAREAIREHTGDFETIETTWKSIRKHTIRLRVQQFLFKAIHNTPMTGEVWFKIDGYQHRGTCTPCNTTENMEHILTTCTAGHAAQVWDPAKKLWLYEASQWPNINLGIILGCRCLTATGPVGNRTTPQQEARGWNTNTRGASRLLQITISEAAHLIWVLQRERVIQETTHTTEEVKRRWYKAINRRLTDDKFTATIIK